MECIVIGERIYRVKHRNLKYIETVIQDWNTMTNELVGLNYENYMKSYRTILGISLNATIEEEASYIHETYGVKPYKNQEFVSKLHDTWNYKRGELPNFIDWLSERGIEASVETDIFWIDEEADYG